MNVEFSMIIWFAFMYKLLFDELKIWFLLSVISFKVMLNYSASIRNVVAELENWVYRYSFNMFSINETFLAIKLPGLVDRN